MANLDRENTNRSYCFGRLTAVYEIAEARTMLGKGSERTLASQLLEGFMIQHPADGILKLQVRMSETIHKLKPATREFFYDEITSIIELMDPFADDYCKPVDYYFTEGYYHERYWLKNYKKEEMTSDAE